MNLFKGNGTAIGLLVLLMIVAIGISAMCIGTEYFEGETGGLKSVNKTRAEAVGKDLGVPKSDAAPIVRPSPADTKSLARNVPAVNNVPAAAVESGLKTDAKGPLKETPDFDRIQAISSFDTWDETKPMMLEGESGDVLPENDKAMRFVNSDLLPKSDPQFDATFAELAPETLKGQSFLDPSRHMIMHPPLRNTNFQIRSETANPIKDKDVAAGWNMSTIQPDVMRRPLEIGPEATA